MTANGPEPAEPLAAGDATTTDDLALPSLSPRMRRRLIWLSTGLAIALVAGAVGFAVGGASRDGTVDDLNAQVGQLGDATAAAIRISGQPDAHHVALVPVVAGDRAAGRVDYAPGAGLVLVVATGLAPEPAGYTYWGWLESNGQRRLLGSLTWAGGAWSWSGMVDRLGTSVQDIAVVFRVSLVSTDTSEVGEPVLTGAP